MPALLVGIFVGVVGADMAWAASSSAMRRESHLPVGTLVVNVVGCFLFGVVWSLEHERLLIGDDTRVVILAGFMGAFTTFSTFIFETGVPERRAGCWQPGT